MEPELVIDHEVGWTRDWRPPWLRRGRRYHDSPSFREMMHILDAMDPHLDRFENRGSLVTVRNNRLWMWPSYGSNLQMLYVTLAVEVRFHCVLEAFVVCLTEEIFESSMESIVNFFACRVYAGASWDVVVPLVSVMTQGRAVEGNWALTP